MKISKKNLIANIPGRIFYLYLFLISAPIFINFSSGGMRFANYLMGTRQGFTVSIGILLLPAFVILLGLKLFNDPKLKTGHFGKLIIIYCYICFLVMLYGQLKETRMIRIFLLGQVMTPFIAYFYLLNFSKHIRFKVVKIILIFSLLLQFCLLLYLNYRLSGSNIFTSSSYFRINNKEVFLYGQYDYYPILFLTLVIFFHSVVNRAGSFFKRNVLIILTIILYAYGLMFHSRNSMIALIFLFAFYLFKRIKEKTFFSFFVWAVVIVSIALTLCPDILVKNNSFTRLRNSVRHARDYLTNGTLNVDASAEGRLKAQAYTFKIMKENSWAGIAFQWPYAAHNQYLSVLGISGIVSFSIFMLLIWLIYKKLKRDFSFLKKTHQDTQMVGAMYGIFVLFIVSSLFQNNFTVTYTSFIFWALMGIYEITDKTLLTNRKGLT